MSTISKLSLCAAVVLSLSAGFSSASPPGGARHDVHQVLAYDTDVFYVTFRADEAAMVLVSGDGDTDLDLYVYDENGNLIANDIDATDDCVVSFTPKWTGSFRIEVKNLGSVYNEYSISVL
jgi:hypothetical protein